MSDWIISAVIVFVLVDLLLMAWVFYRRRRRPRISASELDFVRRQWQLIRHGNNPKNDILEADKLLDFVLGKQGYTGSLGEKLKLASKLFSDLNAVWAAHKLRNRLAHELDFQPNNTEITAALAGFHRALVDLGVKL